MAPKTSYLRRQISGVFCTKWPFIVSFNNTVKLLELWMLLYKVDLFQNGLIMLCDVVKKLIKKTKQNKTKQNKELYKIRKLKKKMYINYFFILFRSIYWSKWTYGKKSKTSCDLFWQNREQVIRHLSLILPAQ